MAQNNSDEMDFGSLWERIKKIQTSILLSFYRVIRFFIKNWIILLALVIVGVLAGFILERNERKSKEANLIVQINFNASNYVYNSVKLLNKKIQDRDIIFLKEMGFYKDDKAILTEIKIEPIVNFIDILDKINSDNKNVTSLFEQAQYEDNLLTSEIFIPEYKTHRILIKTTDKGSPAIIENLLGYLNDNDLMQQIKDLTVEHTKGYIQRTNQSVSSIDSIVKKYGSLEKSVTPSQVYFNSVEGNNNMHLLFSLKNTLIKNNQQLEVELLKYDNVVVLLDNPLLTNKNSFFDKKMKIFPVLFVLLFIAISIIFGLYKKAAGIEDARNPLI